MKGLVGLAVVGLVVCVGGWFMIGRQMSKEEVTLAMAYGNVDGDTIEMHAAIPIAMHKNQSPELDLAGRVLWDEWVADHFLLESDGGERISIDRMGHTPLLPENKVGGAPEFFIRAKLRQGTKYTFEFKPIKEETKRFRHTFAAPSAQTDIKREIFAKVDG